MTDSTIGFGTLLYFGDGNVPDTYTLLAERVNIAGPGMSRDTPDATHMDSPNGWREFLAGLKDAGELTIEGNHVPTNTSQNASAGALKLFVSGALRNWKLVFPTSPAVTWILPARVSAFEVDNPLDDKRGVSITLKLSGEPTLA